MTKKTGGAYLKRHRPEDGIPKEEEEKPRKRILQQLMVRCNSFFIGSLDFIVFLSVFLMLAITKCDVVRRSNMV